MAANYATKLLALQSSLLYQLTYQPREILELQRHIIVR
jgi:hypothetical protein